MSIIKKLLLSLVFIFTVIVVTGCVTVDPTVTSYTVTFEANGGSEVKALTVDKGQPATSAKDFNITSTKEGHEFSGWFTNKELTNPWDENAPVNANITVYAKWKIILLPEEIFPLSVSYPESYLLYLNNKSEKENKRTEFFDLTQKYQVGDDNNWSCKPEVSFVKYNPNTDTYSPANIKDWEFKIKISILEADGYHLLSLENGNNYIDSVTTLNALIDFSSEAVGHTFKVEVDPLTESKNNSTSQPSERITYEIEVVDGYNLYNAKELSFIDNRKTGVQAEAWKAFKEANGLDKDYKPAAIILHNNLNITSNDVPKEFFYQESEVSKLDSDYNRVIGSMKDYYDFYFRDMSENENFALIGNYFTLSIESLREVVRDNGKITPEGEVISHATLLRFEGAESGHAQVKNLNIVGNAPRVENTIKAGGQIFVKVEGPQFTATNNIASCFFIVYMPNVTFTPFLIDSCKAYDSFNSFIYNWGSDKLTIKDSEFIGAGGPIIIQDHVRPTSENGGQIAKTQIINSTLESYVAGTEGWFTVVKASSIIPQIKALDALFNPFGRSFLKFNADKTVSYFNFICINKSGSAEGITNEKIKGELKIDSASFNFGANNPYVSAFLNTPAPVFETSAGGYAYTDGATGLFNEAQQRIVDPANNMYKGDYLALYYSGMMIVFAYGTPGQLNA